ncbi:MAG TPA: DUF1501 domain-containing protein [Vicinamibacterales bacterium]|nr:DUF1501 domain-containing protein [Vicinamibacterales bacterium]
MNVTRREFLLQSASACVGYALGAAAFAAGVQRFSLINALAQGLDYKALVCVFMAGGNDGNNLIVPTSTSEYGQYAAVRTAAGLAIAQDALLPIVPASLGAPFGFHPSLAELHGLWTDGVASIVCNVGPLVVPLTRQQYLAGAPRPYQLFSHSDQVAQWQTAISDRVGQTGWGGRTADRFDPHASGFPMITALSGGIFTRGQSSTPLSIAPAPTALNQVLVLNGFGTTADEVARRQSMDFLRTIDTGATLVAATGKTTDQALDIGGILGSNVTLATAFPNTTLGNQLLQVAKVIKFNSVSPELGLRRQIFFCQLGGFDTHQNQVNTQSNLLAQVSKAVKAFHDATVELGVERQVTTFTLSDFGRTLQPAGAGGGVGSDHAWGNHHIVVGGAVRGGDFYGVPGPGGTIFPVLQLSGPSDTDNRGRWIPTVSVEQYAATLATWYGVAPPDLPIVFPNIGQFATSDLGFML